MQGVKIKEVLSPSDSNSTGPTGQASNVGLKLPVDVGLLHSGGRLGAQPLSTVKSLLRPIFGAETAACNALNHVFAVARVTFHLFHNKESTAAIFCHDLHHLAETLTMALWINSMHHILLGVITMYS